MRRRGRIVAPPEVVHLPDAHKSFDKPVSAWWQDAKTVIMRDREKLDLLLSQLQDRITALEGAESGLSFPLKVSQGGTGLDDVPDENLLIGTGEESLRPLQVPTGGGPFFLRVVNGRIEWSSIETELGGALTSQIHKLNFVGGDPRHWQADVLHKGNTVSLSVRVYRTEADYKFPHQEVECDVELLSTDRIRISVSRNLTGLAYAVVQLQKNVAPP